MKVLNKRYLALVVAGAVGVTACGSDGKDGEDGTTPPPPTVGGSLVTNVEVLSHSLEEGLVRFEFEITNEEGVLITGLEQASAEVAELTEKGIQRSRDGSVGGSANVSTEGASLTMTQDGRYEFIAPMAAVNAGTEGLIRLVVGGGDNIAKSRYIVVDKTENIHTTSTATCQSCHVDFLASSIKHSSYTAINAEGETDLVAGCLTCHNHVPRDVDDSGSSLNTGGYAKNSLQKIGHINHQKFEKDFAPSNCYTCHAEPIETVYSQQTCIDCHDTASVETSNLAATFNAFNEGSDMRLFHKKVGEKKAVHEQHSLATSQVYNNESGEFCTDISLFKGEQQLDLQSLTSDGTISYIGAYLHGYENASIVGRAARSYSTTFDASGSATLCFSSLDEVFLEIIASSRVTFNFGEDAGYDGVTLHGYSDALSGTEYARRHSVTADSCTTCHTNGSNYHKNGSYNDGGLGCIACHNNGQDRNAKGSAPGFGPMVHSMHWGVGNTATDPDGEANSAAKLNAENCVACHAEGIDINSIPNQYILSKAYNGGESGVMTSPVTANCFACHNDESAKNHMLQQGGEINVEKLEDWYTLPTSESCATCHAEGKSYGIEKFHVFKR
ncbi:cytochrome c3 family protein [uncultured Shewanella sp.]|uniref:multiheme c-type cytochrome n=1 Tax=Shewanella atlantica TaxID=271099 RepID=UPI00262AA2F2|nr:cytochrome c3 family protein [uncultured Shewanella sp.]